MKIDRKSHLNILFPQWQGSGRSKILHTGAKKIKNHFLNLPFREIQVQTEKEPVIENSILGYQDILTQMNRCRSLIEKTRPGSILVIGGDCGVEPIPVSYLNQCYHKDLVLIWFDAHGDLNTPQTSVSHHFHGMPLRTLCGESDAAIIQSCFKCLEPEQVVLAGAREFDPAEKTFIQKTGLTHIRVPALNNQEHNPAEIVLDKGYANAYIHVDLDVLDPEKYKNIKHPTPGGINIDTLCRHIKVVSSQLNVVGMGIVEFVPDRENGLKEIEQIIQAWFNPDIS